MLEDRLTPSAGTFYWMGANTNGYGDTANWYRNADHSLPVSGDQVFVANGSVSNDFTVPSTYTFSGLHLAHGFSGTVSLQDETSVGQLDVYDGSIAMVGSSGSGNDLYVTSSFTFTGGNLNSSSNTGTVHIQGISTATIGTDSGKVTTGSTLKVESGTTLWYANGTIAFGNEAILQSCFGSVIKPSYPDGDVGDFVQVNQQLPAPRFLVDGEVTLKNNTIQGYLVTTNGDLRITKSITINGNNNTGVAALGMNAGKITLTTDITLTLVQGFSMSGGIFQTKEAAGAIYLDELTVHIVGNATVTGGTIQLYSNTNDEYMRLAVDGDTNVTGGTFLARLDGATDSTRCDSWTCTGIFEFTCAFTITPTASQSGISDRSWSVIEAAGGLSGEYDPTTSSGWNFLYDNPRKTMRIHKIA